jgi:carbonic anhydrase/acetyltransferase-like protein (isoleucine patch superfamily)
MAIWGIDGKEPVIGKGTFVFPTADVVGDVHLGTDCYVGPGARIRGDYGKVRIGSGTAVEENVVIHARPDDLTSIGSNVTIGHGAIIHNAEIMDHAVIGMGAIIADWAVVGTWSVIGEGAVVKNKQRIPDKKVAVGVPAKVIADTSEEFIAQWSKYKKVYARLANDIYPRTLTRLD